MVREQRSFDQAYLTHLPIEQRKNVLRAIRDQLDPETTVGDVVDAAESLGFSEELGEVMLLQLAKTLLGIEDEDDEPQHHLRDLSPGARRLQSALALRFVDWDEAAESEAYLNEVLEASDEEATEEPAEELASEVEAEYDDDYEEPTPRRAAKKRATKKRSSKKRSSKKSTKKRGSKKKSSKRASKKKASKRGAKKAASKRAGKKRSTKKTATRKKASKRGAKKATKKKSTRRRRA